VRESLNGRLNCIFSHGVCLHKRGADLLPALLRVSGRMSGLGESVASNSRSAILEKMVRNASDENECDDENGDDENDSEDCESEDCELRTLH